MIRTSLIFLLLLGSIWLGVQLHNDPGYVLVALNHWTLEVTVWTALITILTLFFILHLFLLSLSWVIHLPQRWNRWLTRRHVQHAQEKSHLDKRRALQKSLALKKTPEAYFALGELLNDLNDTAGACATYREGLRCALSSTLPPK
jgi:uncharacterized protein HemY